MLIIRKEQIEVLSKNMKESFIIRMMVHLKKFWPERCEQLGNEAVRNSIYEGIEFTRMKGITTEYDIARYIDLTYELHWPFGEMPPDPHVQDILDDRELDGSMKMNRLYDLAGYHFVSNSLI